MSVRVTPPNRASRTKPDIVVVLFGRAIDLQVDFANGVAPSLASLGDGHGLCVENDLHGFLPNCRSVEACPPSMFRGSCEPNLAVIGRPDWPFKIARCKRQVSFCAREKQERAAGEDNLDSPRRPPARRYFAIVGALRAKPVRCRASRRAIATVRMTGRRQWSPPARRAPEFGTATRENDARTDDKRRRSLRRRSFS